MSISDKPLRAIIWCSVSTKVQAEDDKTSLPEQEREALAVCARNGWEVVDTLRVPGHSRYYKDIHDCSRDMLKQGIDAFARLIRHWEARDFDVLIVRDGNRFARKQSLHARVVEETIDAGAKIFSLYDGWVDENNYMAFTAINGYAAAAQVRQTVKLRSASMNRVAQQGLPVSSKVPLSHKLIRDPETGRAAKLVVNEQLRLLWNDLATLILEGISWRDIEKQLYERFGHVNHNNKPYQRSRMYHLVHSPVFWGNSARNFKKHAEHWQMGMWTIEPGHPIPEGAVIYYNTHEPVYTGDLAERVKSELRRRSSLRGRARPKELATFSALLICGVCGYNMAAQSSHGIRRYHCVSKWQASATRPSCDNFRYIREDAVKAFFDEALKGMLHAKEPDFFASGDDSQAIHSELQTVQKGIDDLQEQARRLVRQRAQAGDELQELYVEELTIVNDRLKSLRMREADLKHRVDTNVTDAQRNALEEIRSMSLENFWRQSDATINQFLYRLMGNRRLVVIDGKIAFTAPAPVGQGRGFRRKW